MPGWDDWDQTIFGNMPGPGYAAMPASRNIQDVRQAPFDYASAIRDASGPSDAYGASNMGGPSGGSQSFIPGNMTTQDLAFTDPDAVGAYPQSFNPKFRPKYARPYQPSAYGPNPQRTAYDPAWVSGISPGQPGWRTPPSPSGPHPRAYPADQGPQPPIFQDRGGGPLTAASPQHIAALWRLLGFQ